jgi:hypothetical protein
VAFKAKASIKTRIKVKAASRVGVVDMEGINRAVEITVTEVVMVVVGEVEGDGTETALHLRNRFAQWPDLNDWIPPIVNRTTSASGGVSPKDS